MWWELAADTALGCCLCVPCLSDTGTLSPPSGLRAGSRLPGEGSSPELGRQRTSREGRPRSLKTGATGGFGVRGDRKSGPTVPLVLGSSVSLVGQPARATLNLNFPLLRPLGCEMGRMLEFTSQSYREVPAWCTDA